MHERKRPTVSAAGKPVRGLILTKPDCTVVATDDRAQGLLAEATGLHVSGGRLRTTKRQDGVLLARLAAAAGAGDGVMQAMHVPAGEGRTLTLEVMTLRVAVPIARGYAAAIVVSREDAKTEADVCKRYHLTPAETSLALETGRGLLTKRRGASARHSVQHRAGPAAGHLRQDRNGPAGRAGAVAPRGSMRCCILNAPRSSATEKTLT